MKSMYLRKEMDANQNKNVFGIFFVFPHEECVKTALTSTETKEDSKCRGDLQTFPTSLKVFPRVFLLPHITNHYLRCIQGCRDFAESFPAKSLNKTVLFSTLHFDPTYYAGMERGGIHIFAEK